MVPCCLDAYPVFLEDLACAHSLEVLEAQKQKTCEGVVHP